MNGSASFSQSVSESGSRRALQTRCECWAKGTSQTRADSVFSKEQRSCGSHGCSYHGAFEPVAELGSLGQTLRCLVRRSRPVKAIPFRRLVLQVRGPDRIGAF